jgi:hypothetical protein
VIGSQKSRRLGAATVLLQGVVTALFPQMSVSFIQKMIGKNFDNAAELEAKPAYRRQLRAIGIGMVAAAGTDLLMQGGDAAADGAADSGHSSADGTAVDDDNE